MLLFSCVGRFKVYGAKIDYRIDSRSSNRSSKIDYRIDSRSSNRSSKVDYRIDSRSSNRPSKVDHPMRIDLRKSIIGSILDHRIDLRKSIIGSILDHRIDLRKSIIDNRIDSRGPTSDVQGSIIVHDGAPYNPSKHHTCREISSHYKVPSDW